MASVSDFISEEKNAFSFSVSGFVPRVAFVPFNQEKDSGMDILVKAGDTVSEGQTIAQHAFGAVHATIPGKIAAISVMQLPNGKQTKGAKIALGGSFSYIGKKHAEIDWHAYDAHTVQLVLAEKGVVNTFLKCESLAKQIQHVHPKSARLLVVRLFDDDPSRVTDSFIASYYAAQIAEGTAIIAKAMQASGIVLVCDSEKPNPLEPELARLSGTAVVTCEINAAKYPAGFMHEIADAVKKLGKEAPFSAIGNRDLYIDSQTALAAYNAVALSTPLMERHIHVTGECLNAAAVMKVKIGTTIGDLAMQCGGFKRPVAKIVVNGMVTGYSVNSLDVPITKMVKSVAFLPARKAKRQHNEKCIGCGLCRKICPVGLYPDMLYRSFIHGEDAIALEKDYAATHILCTECGLCNAACPSRIPLTEIISLVKGAPDEK